MIGNKIVISVVYHNPDGKLDIFTDRFCDCIDELNNFCDSSVIGGNFNIPFHSETPQAIEMHNLLASLSLSVAISEPTTISDTV